MVATDAIVLCSTMATSLGLKFGFEVRDVSQGPFGVTYPTFAGFIAVGWLIALAVFDTRDPHVIGDGVLEYQRLVRATVLAFGSLAIASVLFKWSMSRGFLAISFPLGLVGLLASRRLWRIWLARQRRHGKFVSRALVVGGLEAGRRLAHKFNGDPNTGVQVAGIRVVSSTVSLPPAISVRDESILVANSETSVIDAIAESGADTVIVTRSEQIGPDGMRELAWAVESVNAELMVSPNLVDVSAPRMQLGRIADEQFIHLQRPQYAEAGSAAKVLFDLVVGGMLTLAALPILAAASIAIKLSSPGPVFFLQNRIGKDGKPFHIYKLRTMVAGADTQLSELLDSQGSGDEPLFKIDNDPRITGVGRLLRRLSIDELPQLINVLKGEMSLVGPRPQQPEEVELYDHKAERRLTVRPGMTGLWQVSGRSNLSWEEAVRLDLYYVENWSMTGDLVILWKTIRAVLGSDGAY